jgi:hypothetical protein
MPTSVRNIDETPPESAEASGLTDEYLEGADAIARYLGWNIRKVRYARETRALPIRAKHGIGLYAFKSEILAALKTPDTLARKDHTS